MNVLNVQDLRKSYGTRVVFDGVAFAVDEGERVGFIGANGSGKSTLFRIVAAAEGYEGGTLALRRGARVGYLAQEPELEPGLTIFETVAAGRPELGDAVSAWHDVARALAAPDAEHDRLLQRQARLSADIERLGGWDFEHRIEAVLTRLDVLDWDRRADDLSGGERKRVALARVLVAEPDLLLLDEPTNHLDADTVAWIEAYLEDFPGAVLLITHDRYFLDRVVDRMLEVAQGALTSYDGGYTEYLEAKAAEAERAAAVDQKRAQLIAKELDWARRAPPARTGNSRGRRQRLDALRAAQRERRAARRRELVLAPVEPPRLGRTVLNLHKISKGYDSRTLIRDFSAILKAGERIGVIGPNGAGKTTLLRIILGEEPPDAGEVELGGNTRIAYFDQQRSDLDPEKSIYEALDAPEWVQPGGTGKKVHLRSYLDEFLFPPAIQDQAVRSLSGGERNRLLLAKLLLKESNLLILDEPTNDLDLVTLRVLESVLADYAGCVLTVTHDRYFLDKVATALFVFEGGGVVHRHEGGYDLYRKLRDTERDTEGAEPTPSRSRLSSAPMKAPNPRRKLTWKEERELEALEARIAEAEAERERLAEVLGDPAVYSDGAAIVRARADYDAALRLVDELYARWAELEEKRTA